MNNRLTLFTFIIATILAGCASTPTRLDKLNTENTGLTSDIKLNGVLISHGNKFVLDKAFRIPKAPWDYSISFTDVPTGPWEFYGYSFFPKFDSSSITCADSDCDQFNQLKGPFINFECKAITGHGDVQTSVKAIKSGAIDFIEKPIINEVLIASIKEAFSRFNFRKQYHDSVVEMKRHSACLTKREKEIMQHVVAGVSNREIAKLLDLSNRTIEVHRSRAMKKMGAESIPDLVLKYDVCEKAGLL